MFQSHYSHNKPNKNNIKTKQYTTNERIFYKSKIKVYYNLCKIE